MPCIASRDIGLKATLKVRQGSAPKLRCSVLAADSPHAGAMEAPWKGSSKELRNTVQSSLHVSSSPCNRNHQIVTETKTIWAWCAGLFIGIVWLKWSYTDCVKPVGFLNSTKIWKNTDGQQKHWEPVELQHSTISGCTTSRSYLHITSNVKSQERISKVLPFLRKEEEKKQKA